MALLSCTTILFDLGGVLVRLTGAPRMMEWTGHLYTEAQLWERWLSFPSARQFECGRLSPQEFALHTVREFNLPVLPGEFLAEFESWAQDLYPGAEQLLENLSGRFQLGIISNTNALHWDRLSARPSFRRHFEPVFVSHELGMAKPDPRLFEHVLHRLQCDPADILFLDDTPANVRAAAALGLTAHTVSGLAGTVAQLEALGILEPIRTETTLDGR